MYDVTFCEKLTVISILFPGLTPSLIAVFVSDEKGHKKSSYKICNCLIVRDLGEARTLYPMIKSHLLLPPPKATLSSATNRAIEVYKSLQLPAFSIISFRFNSWFNSHYFETD